MLLVLCLWACHRQDDVSRVRELLEQAQTEKEQHDADGAIRHLHECRILLKNHPQERELAKVVLSLLGDMYLGQKNYAESLPVYREFLTLCETDRERSIAFHDLSSYYVMMEQQDSALYYAQLSLTHALADGDSLKTAYRYHSLAMACHVFERTDSALTYAQRALEYVPHDEPRGTYLYAIGSLLYEAEAPADSVRWYMDMAAADTTFEGRFNTYYILSEMAEEKGDYPAALRYLYQYTDHLDSLYMAERSVDVQQLVQEYQTQLRVAEERERGERRLWMAAVGFVLAAGVLTVLWLHNLRRKEQLYLRMVAMKQMQQEEYRQSEAHIADNLRLIEGLKGQIEDLGTENKELKGKLQRQIEKMEAENRLTQLIISDREEKAVQVKVSEIYTELMTMAEGDKIMRAEQVQQMEALLDGVYPDFRGNLPVNPTESPFEYQLCLLTKMGIRGAAIAVLTSHTPSGVSRAKERLYTKLSDSRGKAADFDRYINNLG